MNRPPSRPRQRKAPARKARAALAFTVFAASIWAGINGLPRAGATTPGTPGTAQAPTVIFTEGFENGVGANWVSLTGYTGASGMTYTADPAWLSNCNGVISQYDSPNVPPGTGCSNTASWNSVRELSYAAAMHTGSATPSTNHSLSAYTHGANPASTLELQTTGTITLPSANRYLTMSVVGMATSCWTFHPQLAFSLLDGATDVPVFSSPIDPCSGTEYLVPALGGTGPTSIFVGTFNANAPVLFPGSTVGIRLRNLTTTGTGNDGGIDDVTLLDVTPQMDKSFSPALIGRNGVSTLTFTITNTTDLLAKPDWSFTDSLPAGVVIAPTPNIGGTCTNSAGAALTTVAAAGASTITVTGGDLATAETSCTVTVDVTSAAEGAYTNGPSNMTSLIGLNPPGTTTLTVRDPRLTLVQALGSSRLADSDQFTVDIRTGSAGGASAVTSTTAGTAATVTPGTGSAGPLTANAGTPYFLTQTASGTTSLPTYISTITCTDANVIQSGLPTAAPYTDSFTLTLMAGTNVTCVVTSTAIPPTTTTSTTTTTIATTTTTTTLPPTTTTTIPETTTTTTIPETTTTTTIPETTTTTTIPETTTTTIPATTTTVPPTTAPPTTIATTTTIASTVPPTTVPATTTVPETTTTVPPTTTTIPVLAPPIVSAPATTAPLAPANSSVPPQPLRGIDDEGTTPPSTPIDVPVLVNDPSGPVVSVVSVTPPGRGRSEIVNGDVRYTPEVGFVGTDTFTYTACAPSGQCITQVVTIHVVDDPAKPAVTTAPAPLPIAAPAAASMQPPLAPTSIAQPDSVLAFTGHGTADLLAAGMGLLVIGALVLATARRRTLR